MPEFFGKRFGSENLKIAASIITFIFMIPYTASLYNGLSRLFGMAFNIDYSICVVVMAILTGISVAFIHLANVIALLVKLCTGQPVAPAVQTFAGFLLFVFVMGWFTAIASAALTPKGRRPGLMPVVTFPLFSLVLSASVLVTLVFPTRRWKPIPHGTRSEPAD
jgi:hypothetical protein